MAGVRHGSQERLGPGYQSARSDRGNASTRGRRSREDPCSGALTVAFSLQQRSFLAWFPSGGERGGYASPVARALPTSYWAADRWFFEPGGRPAPPEPAPGPPPMTPGPAPPAPHVFPSTPTPTALRPPRSQQAARCLPLPPRDHAPHMKKPLLIAQGLPMPQRTYLAVLLGYGG